MLPLVWLFISLQPVPLGDSNQDFGILGVESYTPNIKRVLSHRLGTLFYCIH